MAEDDAGSARIRIVLDDTGVATDARAVARRIEQALDRGTRGIGERIARNIQRSLRRINASVEVHADLRPFERQVQAALRAVRGIDIQVGADATRFRAELRAALVGRELRVPVIPDTDLFRARLAAELALIRPVTVPVTADTSGLAADIRRAALLAGPIRVPVRADVDRNAASSVSRLTGALSGLGSVLGSVLRITVIAGGIAFLAASAAAALAPVAAFIGALAPLGGIVAVLPAALAGTAVAIGALALALNGVGEAFGAALTGDADEFKEAIEDLSPAARAAAHEVRALGPAFEDLRENVQDAFFEEFEGQITKVASALGGPLSRGLTGVAQNFGIAAAGVADFLRSASGVRSVTQIMEGAETVTGGFSEALPPIIAGFTRLAAVISEAFGDRLGSAIASAGQRFGEFMSDAASSGRAVDWVEDALVTFRQLGALLGNLSSIFGSVFSAAEEASGGILQTMANATGELATFLKTAEGASSLEGLFDGLGEIGQAVTPVVRELITALGILAPVIGSIAQAVGPVLAQAIGMVAPLLATLGPSIEAIFAGISDALAAMGPGLTLFIDGLAQGLAALGPAFGPIGAALGAIMAAVAPLLPAAGQLIAILAELASAALVPLAEALTPVIASLVEALMPAIVALVPIFQQFLAAATPLVMALGEGLAQAIQVLLPPLLALVPQLLEGLLPAFEALFTAVTPLIPLIMQLITQAIAPLIPLLGPVIEMIASLVGQVAQWLVVLTPVISAAIRLVSAVSGWLVMEVVVPLITKIVGGLQRLISVVTSVIGFVQRMVSAVIGFFRNLYNTLVGNSIVPDLVNGIISWFGQLPARAASAIAGIVGQVVGVFQRLASQARSTISSMISGIISLFSGLGGRILSAMGDIAGRIRSRITSGLPGAVRRLIPGFADGGIIKHEMLARVGEGGKPEVIIPLTKPQRARQLAEESGLTGMLNVGQAAPGSGGGGRQITNHFTITEVGDAETTATRVVRRMTLAAGAY